MLRQMAEKFTEVSPARPASRKPPAQTLAHVPGKTSAGCIVVRERIEASEAGRGAFSSGSLPPAPLSIRPDVPAGKKEIFAASSSFITKQGRDRSIELRGNKLVTGTGARWILCLAVLHSVSLSASYYMNILPSTDTSSCC